MSEKKAFCEECRRDVTCKIIEKQLKGRIKGEEYCYAGKEVYCADCGSEIYDADVNDDNLKALYDVYRVKHDIVSLEMIQAIPKKYAIGKRPLSRLLGWGEQTFTRYCDGDMPTRQYSDILKKIYREPQYFAEILEKNKDKLKSQLAYEKSRNAIKTLLKTRSEKTKIDSVTAYVLHQCEDITPLALQKVLYYIQGFYFAFYDTFLFSEDCEAWIHGPVYRDIYYEYRDYHFDPIQNSDTFDITIFSSSEIAILDSVVNNICCYSGKVLEQFTHMEHPWMTTRGDLCEHTGSVRMIEKELIADYFHNIKEIYSMRGPEDIKKYTQTMFQKL